MEKETDPMERDGHETLDEAQVLKVMNLSLDNFTSLTGVNRTVARVLLDNKKWDISYVTESYFTASDSDNGLIKFFEQAGITGYPYSKTSPSPPVTECQICLTEQIPMVTGGNCDHSYCLDCYRNYIKVSIQDNNVSNIIRCPGNCTAIVDDTLVMELLKDEVKVLNQFTKNIMSSFVTFNKRMSFCPGTGCSKVIQITENPVRINGIDQYTDVTCGTCSSSFCFNCGLDGHELVPCPYQRAWTHKMSDREGCETTLFLKRNTKECPNCGLSIEKNGGCNHMTCKKCKHQFCWICFGLYGKDMKHVCVKFQENKNKSEEKIESERFAFAYDRYTKNLDSLQFGVKMVETVDKTANILMNDYDMSWSETRFLEDAVKVIIQCRKTLTNCCVFSYFTDQNNQKVIFEDNLQSLFSQTEKLTEYLELDMTPKMFIQKDPLMIRDHVRSLHIYCRKMRQTLIDHVKEGMEQDSWIFNSRSLF